MIKEAAPGRLTPPQATSASDASSEQSQLHHNGEEQVMSNKLPPEESHDVAPQSGAGMKRRDLLLSGSSLVAASALSAVGLTTTAQAQQQAAPAAAGRRPNIVVIMGDDVGWFNIGAYHRGIMSGKTPNLDKLASEGMMFTDYYAEASCTAGRANFITGELPIRTGLTTVGQAGADVGIPAQAATLATALKAQGYATGQFGKNHLGDLNKYLPTLHGFDEFFGYLYHLDAMSDPYWYSFPIDEKYYNTYGPRSVIHSYATDTEDSTEMPRWGKIGKQRIVDEGPLPPFPDMSNVPNMHDLPFLKPKYDMTTFDEVLVKASTDFMSRAKRDGKPFFVWHNTTRMHVWTFLSKKYSSMQNSQTNYGLEEAGMTQMDDSIGALMKHLDDIGEANNTILIFTTDNGAEVFTWPDGGMTPFKNTKGTVGEGGFRVPCIIRWPGQIKPGTVENGIFSGLDWFPTLMAAAGNPDITTQLLRGVKLGERTYKNHLDGYNQMDLLTGKGPSKRQEIFYFGGPHLGAVRLDDMKFTFFVQPWGWPGEKVTTDMPLLTNLRQDPFERLSIMRGESLNTGSPGYMNEFFAREFWRFVLVQQYVEKLALTAVDYPPMQDPASFNLDAVKKKIDEMIKHREGQ
ncbi:arylsulfatase A-like enzyme [Bradyrhizobium japonicum]|nr:arylsulfatase [Bradyrhizobium japonicum]MCP1787923.1 arylsulfatase [Bradyrhizobium japonicum]MCP1809799.1 arylsulfatase [Bradyrhizobium japonicum]MCP1818733.1 arylsulfatase [Bradyrhizobium japonicum]MCP1869757.1 arylsulfatase [Bradyrhizobium japonicum]